MATLTKEDLTILKAPFKATEHEFLRGFVYITEFAIVTRIEDVDPAWQFEITALDSRPTTGGKDQVQITCTAALTINGVTRYGVGQAKAYETKPYTDKGTGETKLTEEANEAEKSAATDALKRAARLFGIGRYLLVLPDDIKNEGQLATWIKRMLDAKAKAEGLQGDVAYVQMEQMAKDYLLTGDERILTGDHDNQETFDDREQQEYEDMLTGDPALIVEKLEAAQNATPPTERYTEPTNIVVTRAGEGGYLNNVYHVIEGCTFFSREAFRLLSYDEDIIDLLGEVGVTELPDTVTIVYTQAGGGKEPWRIRRNKTNEVVDLTTEPVLLRHADSI